jgi:hypothetical protein
VEVVVINACSQACCCGSRFSGDPAAAGELSASTHRR